MKLGLVIPGLLDSVMIADQQTPLAASLPNLARLLSRSRVTKVPAVGCNDLLFLLFGFHPHNTSRPPVAAVSRIGDSGSGARDCQGDAYWLRADPVHLRADQSRLVLFDARVLAVTGEEAQDLAGAFNCFYRERGWKIEPLHPDRWYLRVDEAPDIWTTPLDAAAGHDVDPSLPRGNDAQAWHAVMNEVQMLFHEHPVNQARAAACKPAINSLWFWGEGPCNGRIGTLWSRVRSSEPVGRGLALLGGMRVDEAVPDANQVLRGATRDSDEMIVLDNLVTSSLYSDPEGWRNNMIELEKAWFEPVTAALRSGVLDELIVYPCDGQGFRITRGTLRRFWRSARQLEAFVAHA